MQTGLIDSATISQLVQCLDRGTKTQYPWSLAEALDLTSLLIREDSLAVAPGIGGPKGVAIDAADQLLDARLQSSIVHRYGDVDEQVRAKALRKSKQWIGRTEVSASVADEVNRLHQDQVNYLPWLDWAAENAWESHSRRFGGLLDEDYEPYVAEIIGVDGDAIRELRLLSTNMSQLKKLVSLRNEDFELLSKAYLASSIIRGRYHEELSALTNRQLKRHPLRAMVSRRRTSAATYRVSVPMAAWCLACIVLYGATKQKSLRVRMDAWVTSVVRLRAFFNRGGLQLTSGTDAAAMDSALFIARRAGVEITYRRVDIFLEMSAAFGIGALKAINLFPWIGIPAGYAVQKLLHRSGFPARIRNSFAYGIRDKLLKDYMGGRIETEWTKTI
jgi:hypothetical protein